MDRKIIFLLFTMLVGIKKVRGQESSSDTPGKKEIGKKEIKQMIDILSTNVDQINLKITTTAEVTTKYFANNYEWNLLNSNTFKFQLEECLVDEGFLVYEPTWLDIHKDKLPNQVYYAKFVTKFMENKPEQLNPHTHKCGIWNKNSFASNPTVTCNEQLPAICLTQTKLPEYLARQHNQVKEIFPSLVTSIKATLNQIYFQTRTDLPDLIINPYVSSLTKVGHDLSSKTEEVEASQHFQFSLLWDITQIENQLMAISHIYTNYMFENLEKQQNTQKNEIETLTSTLNKLPRSGNTPSKQTNSTTEQPLQKEVDSLRRDIQILKEEIAKLGKNPISPPNSKTTDSPHDEPQNTTVYPPFPLDGDFEIYSNMSLWFESLLEKYEVPLYPSSISLSLKQYFIWSIANWYAAIIWSVLMFTLFLVTTVISCNQRKQIHVLQQEIKTITKPTEPASDEEKPFFSRKHLEIAVKKDNRKAPKK